MAKLILKTADAAIAHVKEGVIENNENNEASFASWANGEHAVLTYIDGQLAALAEGVSEADVISAVDLWLKDEVAFAHAMRNAPNFIMWATQQDDLHGQIDRVIKADNVDASPDWAAGVGPDYIATLGNGDVVLWGAEHTDGRDLTVYDAAETVIESTLIGHIRVRKPIDA